MNALSTWLRLTIWRDGKEHCIEFRDGETVTSLAVVGDSEGQRGMQVMFLPSAKTFGITEFDFATVERRLRERIARHSGVSIVLSDMRQGVERREHLRS